MNGSGDNKKLERFVRMPELEERLGRDRRTIYRKSAAGALPPLRKDGGVVGMLESDVEAHFEKLRSSVDNY
jgi:predicted DNA-binding transcriptional regulator AlpA